MKLIDQQETEYPTQARKAEEFDNIMERGRTATWPYGFCSIAWEIYVRYRNVYGLDKPGEDLGIRSYDGAG